jgi:simple sugar transport system ATP-binding protein
MTMPAAIQPDSDSAAVSSAAPILATRNVTKQFQSVVALRDVTLEARAGSVLALLGDNGAGKSTTVFQDLAVCELMSIARNIVLGNEPSRGIGPISWFDVKKADQIARDALATLGVDLRRSTSDPAATLSGGQRQAVAIARAIYYGSKCLILDEPTAALAVRQTSQVLDQVRRARDAGQAVIIIMHNIQQALTVADEVVVLARGRTVASSTTRGMSLEDITELVMRG